LNQSDSSPFYYPQAQISAKSGLWCAAFSPGGGRVSVPDEIQFFSSRIIAG
jgi:hypothetical protein